MTSATSRLAATVRARAVSLRGMRRLTSSAPQHAARMPPGVAEFTISDSQVPAPLPRVTQALLALTPRGDVAARVQIPLSGANSIVGRAVVVHELQDDLGKGDHSQPGTQGKTSKTTGNAGVPPASALAHACAALRRTFDASVSPQGRAWRAV